jgi:hypothetical protein
LGPHVCAASPPASPSEALASIAALNALSFGAGVRIEHVHAFENDAAGIRTQSLTPDRHQDLEIYYTHTYRNRGLPGLRKNTGSGINISGFSGVTVEHSRAYENGERNQANGGGFDFDGGGARNPPLLSVLWWRGSNIPFRGLYDGLIEEPL